MKKIISAVILALALPAFQIYAEQTDAKPINIKQVTTELKEMKDENKRKEILEQVRLHVKPQTEEDVTDLIELIHQANGDEEKMKVGEALSTIKETDKQLAGAFINALDDKEYYVRGTSIENLGILKAKESAPKLREIVRKFNKFDEAKYQAIKVVDMVTLIGSRKIIGEPAAALITLGQMKDEDAIPLIVEKYDTVLKEYAARALGEIGIKALPELMKLAKKDIASRKSDSVCEACRALSRINGREAKEELLYYLKNEKDSDIRDGLLGALPTEDDDVVKIICDLYASEKDTIFISGMRNKKFIPCLIKILQTDANQYTRAYAAGKLGQLRDSTAVPALEEALKDANVDVRHRAANALKHITGKDYEWQTPKK